MKKNLYTLLIALFSLPGFCLTAQTYNKHDLAKLKTFVEQSANGKRNIDLLWNNAPETLNEDGGNWLPALDSLLIVKWNEQGDLARLDAPYKNLSGIADFEDCKSLKILYLRNNNFTAASVKGCSKLEGFYMCVNQLNSINLEGCDKLEYLSASWNKFETINVRNKSKLKAIYVPTHNLTSLDLRGCAALTQLSVMRGNIANLDLSVCPNLTTLECQGNPIKSLDLSKNPKIKKLVLNEGSSITPLTSLNISGCQLLNSYAFIGLLPDLESLNISNCGLSSINLSKNKKISKLEAGGQQLAVEEQDVADSELKLKVLELADITVVPSDKGVFENGVITWKNLASGEGVYTYDFTTELPSGVTGTPFGGTVFVPWYNHGIPVSNVEVKDNSIVVYSANGVLYIRTEMPQTLRVFNLMGQLVKQSASVTDASYNLSNGIYIVQLGNNTIRKVIVR